MRLLIVDDEELTRSGLISSISWAELGIREVFQAADGLRGLEKAREVRPEIILCDVRMPQMDGIRMAREVHRILPDSAIIFMSGYSDKEYLKAAIRLRAVRYVEKPLNAEEIREAVLEAVEHCRKRQKALRSETHLLAEQTRQLALLLTSPHHKNSDSIRQLWTLLQLPAASRTAVTAILVKFDNQALFTDDMLLTFPDEINAFLKPYGLFALVTHRYQNYLVIHICGSRRFSIRDRGEVLAFLEHCFSPYRNYYITCGQTAADLSAAYQSYETSVFLMESSFFFEPNTILTPDTAAGGRPAKSAVSHIPSGLLQNFTDAVLSCNEETACRCLDDIYRFYHHNTAALSDHAKESYYRLFTCLEDCRSSLKIAAAREQIAGGKTVMRYLEEFFSLCMLHEAILSRTRRFFHDLHNRTEENPTVYLIKRYIRESYARETLSVKDISEHVHLTTSYLCTMFKTETNKTLNQYLTEFRIEQAKKLLKDPRHKISEISAMVGYSDGNYFGKSFKKTVGVPPSEYREKWMI